MACNSFFNSLTRRKIINYDRISETSLSRCLNAFDLTALGVGSTLGAGAYVITGQVAKNDAGPAVLLSFLIAAFASILAGICYAEFGSRVPKTGSAYVYTYVTVGEFLAFVIGWNLILEYVIGAASVARVFSSNVGSLIGDGNIIDAWFNETMPIHVPNLAAYFDPLALGIVLLVTVILALGVKESATFNNIFTCLNLLVIGGIIIAGSFKDNVENWELPKPNATVCGDNGHSSCGEGGFMPYGFAGVVKGAATAFYAYVGFDAISTTGEEVKNAQVALPLSIVLSLVIVAVLYCALSVTITLMVPYYDISVKAPFPQVFQDVGWNAAKYAIGAGAICALSTSLIGAIFPMPRVILAMASDGLIFRFLGNINARFKTPVIATALSGGLAGLMAALFAVEALVNMMSIGTLMAFLLVAMCVLILRYEISENESKLATEEDQNWKAPENFREALCELFKPSSKLPTPFSTKSVRLITGLMVLKITFVSAILTPLTEELERAEPWALALVICPTVFIVAECILISLQPQSTKVLKFKVPLVPFIPALSVFVNMYLMMQLDPLTWLRFGVWMTLGLMIYFGYGIWNSSERKVDVSSEKSPRNGKVKSLQEAIAEEDEEEEEVATEKTPLLANGDSQH